VSSVRRRTSRALPLLRADQRALEDRDRRLELADHRIGPSELVGDVRELLLSPFLQRERALEVPDRQARVAAQEGDLAEAGVGDRARLVVGSPTEQRGVELLGEVDLPQVEGDLGFERRPSRSRRSEPVARKSPRPRVSGRARVGARDAVAGLDPRD
jgi:hypothetical protein